MDKFIAAIIISIIIGGVIASVRSGNNPANDDAFFRATRKVANYRPQIRQRGSD